MGNYSIIVIIMIILLPIIDIVYFSLTSENRNPQLSHNNRDREIFVNFQHNFIILLTIHDVFSIV